MAKLSKNAHRVVSAQDLDGTGQTDALGAGRRGTENDFRRGIEEIAAMVFAYTKGVQPHLVRVLDLFHKLSHTRRGIDRAAAAVECGGEAIDSDLHE